MMGGKVAQIAMWVAFLAGAGWLISSYNRVADDLEHSKSTGPGAYQGATQGGTTAREVTAEEQWEYEAAQAEAQAAAEGSDWGAPPADEF